MKPLGPKIAKGSGKPFREMDLKPSRQKSSLPALLSLGGLAILCWNTGAFAATTLASNAPVALSTNVAVIAATEIAAQSESALSNLRAIESESRTDPGVALVQQQLPAITEEIGARSEENARILSHSTSLELFGRLEASWVGLGQELDEWNRGLTRYAKQLQDHSTHLDQLTKSWQATRDSQNNDQIPGELIDRVNSVLTELKHGREQLNQELTQALTLQNRVMEQRTRIQEAVTAIDQARRQIMRHLFVRDSPPIWSGELRAPQNLTAQGQNSIARQWKELRSYCARKGERFFIQALVFVGLAALLLRAHRQLAILSLTNEALEPAARNLATPVSSALLITLLLSPWLYSQAPRLLWSILGALAIVPALIVLRRFVASALFATLNVLACLYLIDQLRSIAAAQPLLWRLLFLAEIATALVYSLMLFNKGKVARPGGQTLGFSKFLLGALRIATVLFALVFIANILGYVRLSSLLGNVTLSSAYVAIVLYAAIRIGNAMLVVAVTVSPAAKLSMVKRHAALVAAWFEWTLRWVAAAAWTVYVLQTLELRRSAFSAAQTALEKQITIGTLSFSTGQVLLFGLVLWGAFIISRVTRFVLEEEIYPHTRMAPGLHYSISKTLHYLILLVGFLIALALLGINLTKLTILAGAFGVGLGFGMQNIVNNFVSGIILLFERPVKVGDVIQLDDTEGVVKRIGIRASIVRTSCGSEIIVPNAKLISDPVTNWTFSQRRRLITMPIAVASETEPKRVVDVLRQIAGGHPQVAKDGPVQALLTNLNNGTANYELRAWTDQSENWEQVRSDLFMSVKATLKAEGIPMK